MTTETSRARVARLHGVAARRIFADARVVNGELGGELYAAGLVRAVADDMPATMIGALAVLTDEEIVATVRASIEPDIRRKLATAGKLPS